MKKLLAILLSLVMIAGLIACGGETPDKPAADGGSKPEITGVHDMTVEAGHEIDVLEGVSAGDLTSMITIESSPVLSFKGGNLQLSLVNISLTSSEGLGQTAYDTRHVGSGNCHVVQSVVRIAVGVLPPFCHVIISIRSLIISDVIADGLLHVVLDDDESQTIGSLPEVSHEGSGGFQVDLGLCLVSPFGL